MGLFSLEKLFGITIRESATDGSDFTNPDADYRRLFLGEDGQLHVKDSAGTVTDIGSGSGDVATDAIWDAEGDLAVGSGANTAAVLTKGAAGTVPTAGASTLAYAFPPGHEFDYVEFTSDVGPTHTTEATADTVVTANAVTFDGATPVIVEFFSPNVKPDTTAASRTLLFYLYDGAASIGRIGVAASPAAATYYVPCYLRRRLTPSNAAHTYSIRAAVSAGTGTVSGGAGGSGAVVPGYIRITKA